MESIHFTIWQPLPKICPWAEMFLDIQVVSSHEIKNLSVPIRISRCASYTVTLGSSALSIKAPQSGCAISKFALRRISTSALQETLRGVTVEQG
jgi:hypothetical protein